MSAITKAQVKKLRTVASKVFETDEDYRDALRFYGCDSTVLLTKDQASDFISRLEGKQPPKRSYKGTGKRGRQQHLTPAQAERIEILESLLGWNRTRTNGFIKRQVRHFKAVEMLMNYEAVKVITGMQRIIANGDKDVYRTINRSSNMDLRNHNG